MGASRTDRRLRGRSGGGGGGCIGIPRSLVDPDRAWMRRSPVCAPRPQQQQALPGPVRRVFLPGLALWWFLARGAWGAEERESRVWPGQGQGRRGSRCPDKFPGHRCELRRGPDRQTGGMVSPALFPCGRTGTAREGVAHEDLVVAAKANVSAGGEFCEGDESGKRRGRIHSNHRACFFLEPSIPGAALGLVASQIPNDGGGGASLAGEYWSQAQQRGTRDGDSLTDAQESKAQHHAAISQPTTPTQAVGWDGRKPSLWWRPGVPDPWDHRPLGIAAPPLDDLVSCRHAEGACWLVGLLVGLLVGWMDGLRHAGCGSGAGLLQVPSRRGPDPDPRYRSRQ